MYFFTAIGLNARFEDLVKGGKPLLILLVLTFSYIAIQNLVGISGAIMVAIEHSVGVLSGSVSLIGAMERQIAWAPDSVELGITNALEIGVASATPGLIIASLFGGPSSHYLIQRHQLQAESGGIHLVGLAHDKEDTEKVNHLSLMSVLLTLHIAIIIGYLHNEFISSLGLGYHCLFPAC